MKIVVTKIANLKTIFKFEVRKRTSYTEDDLSSTWRKLRTTWILQASGTGGGFYKHINASTDITSAFTTAKVDGKEWSTLPLKRNSVSVDILFILV